MRRTCGTHEHNNAAGVGCGVGCTRCATHMRSFRRHVLWKGSHSRPMSSSTMLAVRMARVSKDEYL